MSEALELPDEHADRDYWISHLGSTLRARRQGRFTVEELSARSEVSSGLISQIERGIGNPSFGTLLRLAHALEIPLAELFLQTQPPENHLVVRRDQRLRMELPQQGVVQELLVPNTDRKLALVEMTIPPGFHTDEYDAHTGEEVVLLVSGVLKAHVGERDYVLNEGDSLSYDASTPHTWSNESDKPAVILAASTPPSLGRAH